ncbi:MAG: ABC transporter substrate-binding protein [Acidobacteriia bacterium]|nr:ABC transporter substrate-binding protein [Terriglobia bacterium]
MSKLRLSLACWNYDRTRALLEDRIPVDGIDLTYINIPVEETFFRMIRHREFDVAEMSLSSYTLSMFREPRPFVAIPVFPSRSFRHSCIYVNRNSGIREPKDLIGKRVGNPEYQLTAGVWIRGILSDDYGVPVSSVAYFRGGEEQPGRTEKQSVALPPEIRLENIAENKTLNQMLVDGEIDAIYSPRAPSAFMQGNPAVGRLFEDYEPVEREYYQRTKIFPIMHTIVIRREVYEQHRWIAQSLYKAFVQAQREVYEDLFEPAALKTMLPWQIRHAEQTRDLMGKDFWPYGFEPNVHGLSTFLRYSFEQGLSKRLLQPQELFVPEALESFKI